MKIERQTHTGQFVTRDSVRNITRGAGSVLNLVSRGRREGNPMRSDWDKLAGDMKSVGRDMKNACRRVGKDPLPPKG